MFYWEGDRVRRPASLYFILLSLSGIRERLYLFMTSKTCYGVKYLFAYSKLLFCKTLLVIFILLSPHLILAEEIKDKDSESTLIVITPNRFENSQEVTSRSVDFIDLSDSSDKGQITISESLEETTGVRMPRVGGIGSPGSQPVEIRGIRTGGTKFLLDGLNLADPSSVSGTFEQYPPFISSDTFRGIEVLKGGSGVLYGSNGQGGAINLRTDDISSGSKFKSNIYGGSFGQRGGSLKNIISNENSDGILATYSFLDADGIDTHADSSTRNLLVKGEYDLIEDSLKITPIYLEIRGSNDLDLDPTLNMEDLSLIKNQDTPKNNLTSTSRLSGITLKSVLSELQSTLSIYETYSDRDFFFDFDGFESSARFKGETFNIDQSHLIKFSEELNDLVFGYQFQGQKVNNRSDDFISRSSRDSIAGFILYQKELFDRSVIGSFGHRVNHDSDISKSVSSSELGLTKIFEETRSKIHSSYTEGYRSPTLFESRGVIADYLTGDAIFVGNESLKQERSVGFDLGFTKDINENSKIDITYFRTDFKESIVYDFVNNTHENGGGGVAEGFELSSNGSLTNNILYNLAYTNLFNADLKNSGRRLRTPKNWLGASITFEYEDYSITPELRYRDSQNIKFFGFEENFKEKNYLITNLSGIYHLNKKIDVYLRGENLADVNYTEAGWQMPGLSLLSGIKFAF